MPQPTEAVDGPSGPRSGQRVVGASSALISQAARALLGFLKPVRPPSASYELLTTDEYAMADRANAAAMTPMAGKKLYRVINLVAGLAIFL